MAYFTIFQGTRGYRMPDWSWIIKADTRRDLKEALECEAESIRCAGGVGLSKRAIASLAAAAWSNRTINVECIAPYRWEYRSPDSFPYALGVFTGVTRFEYLTQED